MSDNAATAEAKLPKDLAAEKGLVNVQIDGVWMQVPRGMRMIEACKLAQKEVPHYCYHPKLTAPGNCRMCLVQMGMPPRPAPGQDPVYDAEGYLSIGWMPRPVIACANTVSENMGIRTTGELVEKCREGVMEFLLINHPLDCPICDQAGECRLQEFSVEHGRGESRFVDMKVKKPKNVDIGPRIRLDDERCIMCSRCIRFMDEVAGDPVLGFTQRGTHTTLTVHRLNFHYVDGDTRLTEPMMKAGAAHQAVTWADAIASTAAELKGFQPHEIAIIASARMTNEELFLTRALAGELDTGLLTVVPRSGESDGLLISADRNPNSTGAKLVWQAADPAGALFSIREGVRSGAIKALLVLGEDLTDAGFTAEDLAKPDFIASIQLLAGATAEASHVILPGAAFAEKRGSMVNVAGRLQRMNRAIEPPAEARDDWEILRDLITACTGEKSELFLIEDLFKHLAEAVPAFNGLTLSKIGHQGTQVLETGYEIPLLTNERARKAAGTING